MKFSFFATSFFVLDDIIDSKKLDDMVDLCKNSLSEDQKKGEHCHGPTYETNFFSRKNQTIDLTESIDAINEHLKDEQCTVKLREEPWFAEYGPTDCHDPHLHCNFQYNINPEGDPKKWNYSMVINLSDIGITTFFNSNYSGLSSPFKGFVSTRGGVIMFPSNILHWVSPHRQEGQRRRVISANLFLEFKEEWLCV